MLPLILSRALSASLLLAKVTNPNPYMQEQNKKHALKNNVRSMNYENEKYKMFKNNQSMYI